MDFVGVEVVRDEFLVFDGDVPDMVSVTGVATELDGGVLAFPSGFPVENGHDAVAQGGAAMPIADAHGHRSGHAGDLHRSGGVEGGAVPELAMVVEAPAPRAAIGEGGAGRAPTETGPVAAGHLIVPTQEDHRQCRPVGERTSECRRRR